MNERLPDPSPGRRAKSPRSARWLGQALGVGGGRWWCWESHRKMVPLGGMQTVSHGSDKTPLLIPGYGQCLGPRRTLRYPHITPVGTSSRSSPGGSMMRSLKRGALDSDISERQLHHLLAGPIASVSPSARETDSTTGCPWLLGRSHERLSTLCRPLLPTTAQESRVGRDSRSAGPWALVPRCH